MRFKNEIALIMVGCAAFKTGFTQQARSWNATVLNEQLQPIAGASLLLQPDAWAASSNKDGLLSFKKIYPGRYHYQLSSLGFQTDTGTVDITENQATNHKFLLRKINQQLAEVQTLGFKEVKTNLIQAQHAAMPVTVIDKRTIELMGSRRLDEVLKEQTGVAIVNNIAGGSRSVGVQMQGFSSEYIMILVDGQPLLGRNSGSLDLSRIAVSTIERIELIKGASSCLYGADALGGAINIITKQGKVSPQVQAKFAAGSYAIIDATLEAETPFAKEKGTLSLSSNYYHSGGYNNNNQFITQGTTVPPFDNVALQGKITYKFNPQNKVQLGGRWNNRNSLMRKTFSNSYHTTDKLNELDYALYANYNHRFNAHWQAVTNYQFSNFDADSRIVIADNEATASQQRFVQRNHRLEQQFSYDRGETINATFGLGLNKESMDQIGEFSAQNLGSYFAYLQANKTLGKNTTLLGGLRYDYTENYGGKINPSLGINQRISEKFLVKAGFGTGFKTPDFKTRYHVFYNPSANYYVIGTEVLKGTLDKMQAEGEISEIRSYLVNQLDKQLKAERSTSLNIGFEWSPKATIQISGSLFRHQIKDQINAIQVATASNRSIIYSYQNLPKAINKGFELSAFWQPLKALTVQLGYQYLIAKDLSVEDSIRTGNWPYNQVFDLASGESFTSKVSDYWGLENRSRHQLNIGLVYQYQPWDLTVNMRANFRGKYPFGDRNGNQFIDRYDTFVADYWLVNASVEKRFKRLPLTVQLTADNVFNYHNYLIPGQIGRVLLAGISYRFIKK